MLIQTFDLADVLTVTTGVSVGDGKMQTVRNIIYWVLGFDPSEHISDFFILPLADKAVAKIHADHPRIASIQQPDFSDLTGDELTGAIKFWVKTQKKIYGRETVDLARGSRVDTDSARM